MVDTKTVYRPSGKLAEVLGFLKNLAHLSDSRVSGAELFESCITRLCQKPCQGRFPTAVQPIRVPSDKGIAIISPRWTPKYRTLRGFTARERISEQRIRPSKMALTHEIIKSLRPKSLRKGYM